MDSVGQRYLPGKNDRVTRAAHDYEYGTGRRSAGSLSTLKSLLWAVLREFAARVTP